MKRRFFLSLLALVFGFGIVCVSAISVGASQGTSNSSEDGKEATVAADLIRAEEMQTHVVDNGPEYYLPYPGMLPDQPFYIIKMLRDRFRLLLTQEEEQKTHLLLLYADKRVGAALVLAQGGKTSLAATTAQKAEKYLHQAIEEASQVDSEELWQTLGRSALKHKQVIGQVHDIVGENDKQSTQQALNLVEEAITNLANKGVITPSNKEIEYAEPVVIDTDIELENTTGDE